MKKLLALTTLLASLLLAACGGAASAPQAPAEPTAAAPTAAPTEAPTAEPSAEPTAEPAAEATPEATAETATDASSIYPITVKHGLGATTIESEPLRIVALEWNLLEDLLALGIQPVGAADIEGYHSWVKIPVELDPSVVDVGSRREPNLEKIAELKPDLILAVDFRSQKNYEQLSQIAPTIAFVNYPPDASFSQYDMMISDLQTIAAVTNRVSEGEAVLAQLDETLAAASTRLSEAGFAGAKYVLAQAYTSSDVAEIRLFTETALASEIFAKLGLVPAWQDDFQTYGFSTVGLEGLSELPDDLHFFYVVQDNDNVFASETGQPVWNSLGFVKAGQTYSLGGEAWLFGGPLSAELIATLIGDLLVP